MRRPPRSGLSRPEQSGWFDRDVLLDLHGWLQHDPFFDDRLDSICAWRRGRTFDGGGGALIEPGPDQLSTLGARGQHTAVADLELTRNASDQTRDLLSGVEARHSQALRRLLRALLGRHASALTAAARAGS